jgi:hypothetical protein
VLHAELVRLTASKPLVQLERAGCYSYNHATVNGSIYVYNIYIYIHTYRIIYNTCSLHNSRQKHNKSQRFPPENASCNQTTQKALEVPPSPGFPEFFLRGDCDRPQECYSTPQWPKNIEPKNPPNVSRRRKPYGWHKVCHDSSLSSLWANNRMPLVSSAEELGKQNPYKAESHVFSCIFHVLLPPVNKSCTMTSQLADNCSSFKLRQYNKFNELYNEHIEMMWNDEGSIQHNPTNIASGTLWSLNIAMENIPFIDES